MSSLVDLRASLPYLSSGPDAEPEGGGLIHEQTIKLWVNQRCLDELREIESLRNESMYLRAVAFLHFLGAPAKRTPKGWKYCSTELMRSFHYRFDSVILPELLERGFCHELPRRSPHSAREFILEFNYEAETPFGFPVPVGEYAKWASAITTLDRKRFASGLWINTHVRIRIDFPSTQESTQALLDYKRSRGVDISGKGMEKAIRNIQHQFEIIESVNRGEPLATRKSNGRAYSSFSELSKPVTSKVFDMDGNRFISCDQHATYFTILPTVLKTLTNDASKLEELDRLQCLMEETSNIYEHIQGAIQSTQGALISLRDIKQKAISWLCTQRPIQPPRSGKSSRLTHWQRIDQWFAGAYPESWKLVNAHRRNAFLSRRIAEVEAQVFGRTSRLLNQLGVPCLYKFDEILVLERDLAFALDVLDFFFMKTEVPNRIKCDNGRTGVRIDQSRFDDLDRLWKSFQRLRVPESVRRFRQTNRILLEEIMGDSHRPKEEREEKQPLPVERARSRTMRPCQIRPFRNRYRCSCLGRDLYSMPGETQQDFRDRLLRMGASIAPDRPV